MASINPTHCDVPYAQGSAAQRLGAPDRGYALASVNYRLSGEVTFPAGMHDTKAEVRSLKAHAREYCLDPYEEIG